MNPAISIIVTVLASANTLALIKVIFAAGKLVQKIDDMDQRVKRLELGKLANA